MDRISPSWTELLGRMAAVSFSTATGEISWRYVNDDEEAHDGTITFWYRRSGDMRIDGSDGMMMLRTNESTLTRDRSGKMQIREGHNSWHGHGSPNDMLGGPDVARNLSNPNDFSTPQGPGAPVQIDGRPGWEFILDPPAHKSYALSVVIDDATAAVLEMRSVEVDNYTTMTRFTTDVEIDDNVFAYDGAIATDDQERRQHREHVGLMEREMKWPTPRYWPTGMGIHLDDADPDTGAFRGMLEDRSGAIFARWPQGNPEPPNLIRYRPDFHVHRWAANGFDWALAVESPFNDDEVERIIASIPTDV